MRDHSDDPKVVSSGRDKNKGNARRVNFNALDKGNAPNKVNSSALAKGNAPDKDSDLDKDNGPGGWTERVAVDRA